MFTYLSLGILLLGLQALPQEPKEDLVLAHLSGVVRDSNDKPIAGANIALTGTRGYVLTDRNSPGSGRATSDGSGHYRLAVFTKPGTSVEILGMRVEARGFVTPKSSFEFPVPVLRPGSTTELNLVLSPGEVLSGRVEEAPRLSDVDSGTTSKRRINIIQVRSQSFQQAYLTDPGGAFEIWVPKGNYTLEVITVGQRPLAELTNIASGTRGLKLVRIVPSITPEAATKAFDALATDLGRNYSYFDLKKIDWSTLQSRYRKRAINSKTLLQFVDVLGEMLAELDDAHISFVAPPEAFFLNQRPQPPYNGNFQDTESKLSDASWIGNGFARVGTIKPDGFGVIRITRQSRADSESVQKVVDFIRSHADAPGFLIDLRGADGGKEMLARPIASEFCAAKTIYAKSKYRNGPKPTEFGPVYDRVLQPSAKPYTKPVVCVLGPGCVSSGEGFAQMLVCLPNVSSIGMPTRGSSGNPKPFKLPGLNVTILYSRWVDMMPDGTPIEGRGIRPGILVDVPPLVYEIADPTWEKAIDLLRRKVQAKP